MLLAGVLAVAAATLLWVAIAPWWRGDESRARTGDLRPPTEYTALSADESAVANLPPITYSLSPGGIRQARIDLDRLRAWCRGLGLPDPPNIELGEPAVAESLIEALRGVVRHGTAAALGRAGQVFEALDCHDGATEFFVRAAAADPADFRWPYYLGCIHQLAGRTEEAVRDLRQAQRLNPAYAFTYARLGELSLNAGADADAESYYRRYVELHAADSMGHVGLGRLALRRGDAQAALAHLQEAEGRWPGDFQAHYHLARAYLALGQKEQAQRHFDICERLPQGRWHRLRDPLLQALDTAVGSVEVLVNELESQQGSEDWEHMADLARRIIERRPEDTTMMGNLASFYRKLKRFDDAHAVLDRATALEPASLRLATVRAEVYLAESRWEEAAAAAQGALDNDADDAPAWIVLGRALFLQNRFEEAVPALQRAVELDPLDAGHVYVLGEAFRRLGRTDEAVAMYRRALEREPAFKPAEEALRALTGNP